GRSQLQRSQPCTGALFSNPSSPLSPARGCCSLPALPRRLQAKRKLPPRRPRASQRRSLPPAMAPPCSTEIGALAARSFFLRLGGCTPTGGNTKWLSYPRTDCVALPMTAADMAVPSNPRLATNSTPCPTISAL